MTTNGTPESSAEPEIQGHRPDARSSEPERRERQPDTHGNPPLGGRFAISSRMLLIGGAGGAIILIIAIVVVVLVATGMSGGGNPQPGSLKDLIPDDAELVVLLDVEQILADDDLADWAEAEGIYDLDRGIFGIDPKNIANMIITESNGGDSGDLDGVFVGAQTTV